MKMNMKYRLNCDKLQSLEDLKISLDLIFWDIYIIYRMTFCCRSCNSRWLFMIDYLCFDWSKWMWLGVFLFWSNFLTTVTTTTGKKLPTTLIQPLNWIVQRFWTRSTMEQRNTSVELEWCLNPILNWLSIIGVDLRNRHRNGSKYLISMFQSMCFLGCLAPHLTFFIYLLGIKDDSLAWVPAQRTARSISTIFYLDNISDFIQPVGIHFCLLYQSSKWKDLWNSLEAMSVFIHPESLKKLRQISTIGVAYIITSVYSMILETIQSWLKFLCFLRLLLFCSSILSTTFI